MPIEYFILTNLRTEGAIVGHLGGEPIFDTIMDESGTRYRYAGLAPRDVDGRFDVGCLRAGEWIVQPGFIYVVDPSSA